MTGETPDADLVRAARDGDRGAFGRLYERYARVVHGVLLARVPRAHVDDLVQEAFVRAMEKLNGLRDPQAFAGWLLAIARNCAADHLRAARPVTEVPEDLAAHDPPHAEAREALDALMRLPEAYRETMILRLVEGMTGPEIARRTGLTEGSVRVNLHRGMRMLRERLGLPAGGSNDG